MTTCDEMLTRLARRLQDADSARFSEEDLLEALRRALAAYSRARPRMLTCLCTFTASGAEQPLTMANPPIQIVRIIHPYTGSRRDPVRADWRLEWEEGAPFLIFSDPPTPAAGERAEVIYTCAHTLEGLDEAEQTTFSASWLEPLLEGAAGYALQQRVTGLAGTSGGRPAETTRLEEESRLCLERFQKDITYLLREAPTLRPLPARGWTMPR